MRDRSGVRDDRQAEEKLENGTKEMSMLANEEKQTKGKEERCHGMEVKDKQLDAE